MKCFTVVTHDFVTCNVKTDDVLIRALAVCIIGGLGSTGGVILASFVIGFAERFTDSYVGSHWTMIVSLAAILIVLIIRPSGLFGKQKELEERI